MSDRLTEANLLRVMARPEQPTSQDRPPMPPMPTRLPTRPRLAGAAVLIAALALTTVLFSFWIAEVPLADATPWAEILTALAVCILALAGALLVQRPRGGSHG
jgi:hypothetical protein